MDRWTLRGNPPYEIIERVTGPIPRADLRKIAPYVPGSGLGDANKIILSSNESALGPSPKARDAYRRLEDRLFRYPEGDSGELRRSLAAYHRLDPDRIVCGNGSDELLGLIAQAYVRPRDEIVHSQYGFLMYPIIARVTGATPIAAPEIAMRSDIAALLNAVNPKTRLMFLANPNNPTGSYLTGQELRELHARLPQEVLLVIDAAYAEFVDRRDYSSGLDLATRYENVVMTRTFSKIYALAGLRLGWMYGSKRVVENVQRVRGPFNVNSAAQAAGRAALEDHAHLQEARVHTQFYRPWLRERLEALGMTAYDSVANFLLIKVAAAEKVRQSLYAQNIVVRGMDAYGLPSCLRITIGTAAELETLLAALASCSEGCV